MAYGNDLDRGPFLNTIHWTFLSISLVVVSLRLISRRLLEKKHWEIDDGYIVLAMAVILVRTIYIAVCVHLGFGQPFDTLMAQDPEKTIRLTRLLTILEAMSLWTWTLPKLPVATLLVRLFGGTYKRLGPILYCLVVFLIIWVTILTVIAFVQCTPVERNWDHGVDGTCWDRHVYSTIAYFTIAYSAALDFAFAIYAICRISSLQIERSRKVLIALSLSLGIPAGGITLYKLSTIVSAFDENGPTWALVPLEVWNCVESCALIIAAAVPMTRPVMSLIGNQTKYFVTRVTRCSDPDGRRNTKSQTEWAVSNKDRGKESQLHTNTQTNNSSEEILLERLSHGVKAGDTCKV
ncbi:hypothetical protein GGR53DRAFT_483341 [Hypoxylon sp. FL1150]|nr:hypothetical protein GGR53DRAFT_483341 [Hypoxylon sp. FL1150]